MSRKEVVEVAIMKESTGRFKLAYSLPFLERESFEELGLSVEGRLAEDMMRDIALLDNNPVAKEVM